MTTGPEGWWAYVQRITDGKLNKEVAKAAGIDPSGVSRWKSGATKTPDVENIVHFARQMGDSPLNALVAVGYISPEEAAETVVRVGTSPHAFDDDALLAEIARRLRAVARDKPQTGLSRLETHLSAESMRIQEPNHRRKKRG